MRAYGRGISTISKRTGAALETWYASFGLNENELSDDSLTATDDDVRNVELRPVEVVIDLDNRPADVPDAYLRLHLLSGRCIEPHGLNVDGIFGVLPLVAWTNYGPVHPDDVPSLGLHLRQSGRILLVHSLDKFPRMTDYVIPSGVRIADANRVRLGAYLADGTVVMQEGFVNFNAGTLGSCMVEGRITSGTVIGGDTDLGAGSSIQGTLSGGGTHVVRIGMRCLLGANSGVSISLGDDCAVEAGLYVTSGTLVSLPSGQTVKARELSGQSGMLLRRNSLTGAVEAVPWRKGSFAGLNPDLHS